MLAATFDQMADRVAAAMEAQRRLLSDVSHQLRTPLTVARGHLEVLGRGPAPDPAEVRETVDLVVDEIDHMRALVERLLLLGRALEPDFLDQIPVDLRTFCLDLFAAARVLAPRDWQLSEVPDVVVDVDEAKLRGALLNLIDNAVRATADGDTVALSVGGVRRHVAARGRRQRAAASRRSSARRSSSGSHAPVRPTRQEAASASRSPTPSRKRTGGRSH